MKRLIILFSTISLLAFNTYAYEERNLLQKAVTLDALKEMLVLNQRWVSYPNYTDRAGWDALLGDSKDAYIKQAEKYQNYQWQVVKASDYLEYERSGDRKSMETPFDDNNYAISTLLLAELAEGKGRFIDQLINGVYLSCEMTSWVLAAHLHAQHSKRALPDYREHVIDLTSGDLSSILAWTYYFLHDEFDKVDPVISKRLYKELKERTMDTYMNEDRFWWMAFDLKPGATVNNWNPWCNSNVLQTFLLLENDKDKLAEAVYRTIVSTDKFINYTKADGACEEGPSYWGHAAGKLYDYLQILYDATGGKVSLFKEPLIKNMGEYISRSYVGNGWVVNFADASAKGGGGAPLIYRYGKAVNSAEMMGYAAYLEKIKSSSLLPRRDIYRALQGMLHTKDFKTQQAFHKTPAYTWYPLTEFCYMKNDNGFFLATKGGYNNESHNHNDIGTFSLYLNTTPIFIDAGVGTYTRQTFSNERYTIWTMQSNYHNLPLINGVSQEFGAQFKASNVKFNPKNSTFSLNIATAYPEKAKVKTWTRTYKLGKDRVNIEDNFDLLQADAANQVNFMTWGNVDISKQGEVSIDVQGEKMVLLYDKNTFNPSIETITLDDPRLSNVWGDEIYRVSLNAKQLTKQGKYKYTIVKKK